MKNWKKRSFTLIEVIMVIVILSTITINTAPKVVDVFNRPKDLEITRDLQRYGDVAQVLVAQGKDFTEDNLNTVLPEQLKLEESMSILENPYGQKYIYTTDTMGKEDFRITSLQMKNGEVLGKYIEVFKEEGKLKTVNWPSAEGSAKPMVNKSLLESKIIEAEGINSDEYIYFDVLQSVISEAHAVNDNKSAKQDEVDDMVDRLTDLISKLVKKGDKTALIIKIGEAHALNFNDYIEVTLIQQALSEAIVVKDDVNANQDEVDTATSKLSVEILKLIRKGDKAALIIKINEAQSLVASQYIDFSGVTTALSSALVVKNNDKAIQSEVDVATTKLSTEISKLVKKGDKTVLIAKINAAQLLVPSEYMTFTDMTAAINEAVVVKNNALATQPVVDAAVLKLNSETAKLVKLTAAEQQLKTLITSGYIPIATADDINQLRGTTPRVYAAGTKWATAATTIGGLNKKYIQVANIDLTSIANFEPIGNNSIPFRGTFNGNGFTINNLKIDRRSQDYTGLFGRTSGATLTNIGLINVNVQGQFYVGSLAGANDDNTPITGCYATGKVSSTASTIGGLVGANYSSTISDSYSLCNVSGSRAVGGLVGFLQVNGIITKCYVAGPVSGSKYEGGIVGHYGSGTVTASYWDTQITTQPTSGGGKGLTTAQMKVQSNYSTWDFTSTWKIAAGGYPKLKWQA